MGAHLINGLNPCICILQAGVDVNLQECLGDTPLHKAAQSGRKVSIHPFTARVTVRVANYFNLS